MRDFSQLLKIFILALVVGIGLNFVTAWTPPTVAPPGGNSATSTITTSSLSQYKGGPLGIGGLLTAYFGLQLSNTVTPGGSCATNGVLGADSNGSLAVCQAGVWVLTAEANSSGVCGASNGITTYTAPTSGLCTSGTATGVSGNGPWTWSCLGLNGGTNASCSASPLYVDDVFSTYTYTGNGSTQTITNGIDLAGQGGLVWAKGRSGSYGVWNMLQDTARGVSSMLFTNKTDAAQTNLANTNLKAFNSNGFTLGGDYLESQNANGIPYASWTFRKAPKFFDVVTYTGTGGGITVNHNLGVAPGMVIIKRTDLATNWLVWHRSAENFYFTLNTSDAKNSGISFTANATSFTTDGSVVANTAGATYVAYLFAHDPDTTNGIIQCGSYNGNGSATGPTVTLGWEPQWLIFKSINNANHWYVADTMRNMSYDSTRFLYPNLSNAEITTNSGNPYIALKSTGFQITTTADYLNNASQSYLYCAIRRPNKPPTLASQIFNAVSNTTGATGLSDMVTTGFPVDLALYAKTDSDGRKFVLDRLRNSIGEEQAGHLQTNSTAAESSGVGLFAQSNTQYSIGGFGSSANSVSYAFRRAPGVFDVVAYTGTGNSMTVPHNLGVVPEMIIVKRRDGTGNWRAYLAPLGITKFVSLESTVASTDDPSYVSWNNTPPTSTSFFVGNSSAVNIANGSYISYLFASKAGISKVGSYTGNGSSQTINAGFSAGPGFVLIKRADSTGDWYVWDSARGIVAGNDPHISLNTTAAEVTTDDSIDPDNSGFIVNQNTATNVNVSGATYIYLAFASPGSAPSSTGQVAYTSPGTYSWTVPTGVTSVSAVCVGAGAGGGGREDGVGGNPGSDAGNGGGGGALTYKNNISVTPGQQLAVVVGAGGAGQVGQGDGGGGGQSSFISMSNLYANGGSTSGGTGGGSGAVTFPGGRGGGASGYGSGGGGGGAGGYTIAGANSACCGSRMGGGGVGLLGGTVGGQAGGLGGSGGTNGSLASNCSGGAPGSSGGGGSGGGCAQTGVGAPGAAGACRIIWPGDTRQFPSTNTADM